jgi:transcriptional regulator with GAF, ATPase, and Fis domain
MDREALAGRIRLYEAREALLDRIASHIGSPIDLDRFLQGTVNEIGKMMGACRCDLLIFTENERMKIDYEFRASEDVPSSLNLIIPAEKDFLMEFAKTKIGPVAITDTSDGKYPDIFRGLAKKLGTKSLLIVPIAYRDEVLGILGIHYRRQVREFSVPETGFMNSLAKQIAIGFEYTRLFFEKEKDIEIAKTLLEIATNLGSKIAFSDISEFIARKSIDLLGADVSLIGVIDNPQDALVITTFMEVERGKVKLHRKGSVSLSQEPELKRALLGKETLFLSRTAEGKLPRLMLETLVEGRACFFVPIVVQKELFGLMCLAWTKVDFKASTYEHQLIEGIRGQLTTALENNRLSSEVVRLRQELRGRKASERIIGNNEKLRRCMEMALHVAGSPTTVLIQGESGTGKELIADLIQENSPRRDAPYVKINCGAITETLLESELFGHEKGAFTGADSRRAGKFEQATGGTLFLDEVGETSLSAQVKLLRVLQDGSFQRVGGTETLKTDVRVIAATNKNMEEEVEKGRFRKDLFYRLNVYPITLPPLRERKEDIPLLVNHCLQVYRTKSNNYIVGIAENAMRLLQMYDWPGNVRELENAIERSVVVCSKRIVTEEDLPEAVRNALTSLKDRVIDIEIGMPLREIEERVIRETLTSVRGVKKKAAEILGIGRKTLYRKLDRMEVDQREVSE